MDEDTENRIRRRAFELWEQDGRPLDRGISYWLAAEREIVGIVDDVPKRDAQAGAEPAQDAAGPGSIVSAFAAGPAPTGTRDDG